jgi:UDP-N-acetylglucosamine--N-acetylmuramyl-(pentapeptide) pyrophosphoryl-undecaprenol N-acetylglucosamine transferase
MTKIKKIIISGGGTGGHIFPALAIANALKKIEPDIKILFVGAIGRMEMEKIPKAGYEIIGLPVMGLPRKPSIMMFKFFTGLFKSLKLAKNILNDFQPDVVVGVGGYASGPMLRMAAKRKIPCLIQEQNSYPGITNKLLAKKVEAICVAYNNMEKFFPKDKIIKTGNPVREDLLNTPEKSEEAYKYFNLKSDKPVILSVGGSLGARTINLSIANHIKKIVDADIQLIWQTGKSYYQQAVSIAGNYDNIKVNEFVFRMDLAYSVADIVISRAGASTISELCLLAKPTIFVPSPNVAEDHQTKNAQALVDKNAAAMISDSEATEKLVDQAIALLKNAELKETYRTNIKDFAMRDSAQTIALKVLELVK